MSASSEIAAVARAAACGDDRAWAELVQTFDARLRSVARGFRLSRADVDDVIQNVRLRAFQARHTLREPAAVGGWLVVMTRRESLRMLQRTVNEIVSDDDARLDTPELTTPETELFRRERERGATRRDRGAAGPTAASHRHDAGRSPVRPTRRLPAPSTSRSGSLGPTRGRALMRLRRDPSLVGEAST